MSEGSLIPNIRFLGQNVCPVARGHTDTHVSEYRGHPFRVSGYFSTMHHQGPVQSFQDFRNFSSNLSPARNGPIWMTQNNLNGLSSLLKTWQQCEQNNGQN